MEACVDSVRTVGTTGDRKDLVRSFVRSYEGVPGRTEIPERVKTDLTREWSKNVPCGREEVR